MSVPRESSEQRAIVGWLRIRGIGVFSVPNGSILGGRSKWAQLAKLKAEGLLPGVPDLVLVDLAPETGQPVAIEVKREKGGRLSAEQKKVISDMRKSGWVVIIANGFSSCVDQLLDLGY